MPELKNDVLINVDNLKKYFPIRKGLFRRISGYKKAVDGVNFFIREGETLGLVGESGCGKTTTGRSVIRLIEPTEGSIKFRKSNGQVRDLMNMEKNELKEARKEIQMIFQDPFSSLNPRKSIFDIVSDPLKVYNIGDKQERVADMLERVGLSPNVMNRYPHAFSGGQRQRVGVARSLILNPKLIIADEPVSALDVSVQAQVINLLEDLQQEMKLTFLIIAHDLSLIEYICDRVMVMYLGKIVEMSSSDDIYTSPNHPYSEALLSAIPDPDPDFHSERISLEGVVPDPADPPSGCNFHTRCSYSTSICEREEPELKEIQDNRFVACHLAEELSLTGYAEKGEAAN